MKLLACLVVSSTPPLKKYCTYFKLLILDDQLAFIVFYFFPTVCVSFVITLFRGSIVCLLNEASIPRSQYLSETSCHPRLVSSWYLPIVRLVAIIPCPHQGQSLILGSRRSPAGWSKCTSIQNLMILVQFCCPTRNNLTGYNVLQFTIAYKTKTPIKMEILMLVRICRWFQCGYGVDNSNLDSVYQSVMLQLDYGWRVRVLATRF